MELTLKVWRQKDSKSKGKFVNYLLDNVSRDSSFLEMMDMLNEKLIGSDEVPVAFDHDCREGICGSCSLNINGIPHGPEKATTTCQLHMRHFKDGDTITIEPWRASSFPVIKDLVTDRSKFDNIIQAGGYITLRAGSAVDANEIAVSKDTSDEAMDYAECIGCGACVSACPNASAMLFTAAKVNHLNILPQGDVEKDRRTILMVKAMDENGFGGCTNYGACEQVCPKSISVDSIANLNKDYHKDSVKKVLQF